MAKFAGVAVSVIWLPRLTEVEGIAESVTDGLLATVKLLEQAAKAPVASRTWKVAVERPAVKYCALAAAVVEVGWLNPETIKLPLPATNEVNV